MAPVPVFTGRADGQDGPQPKVAASKVPLPHLRPRIAGAAAAFAPDPADESPTSIQVKP
jgi:hypothetical protein